MPTRPEEISSERIAAMGGTRSGDARWVAGFLILAIGIPLAYVLLTGHVWEDFLITFRHSKNLVDGNGLVFNPGRRVQGFTSVLNTMLPAFFYWVTGQSGYIWALNLYRLVCLAMFLLGGVAVLRLILRDRGVDRWSPLVFILLYVTEAKTVAFTMNGQESALMVGFLALGFLAACGGIGKHWKLAAVSWTGLLYTRPDVPAHIGALVVGALLFSGESRRETWKGIAKAGACAALAFAPWFVSVWMYYGQPIPHTVLAKSTFRWVHVATYPEAFFLQLLKNYPRVCLKAFGPIFPDPGGWPAVPLLAYAGVCGAISATYWMLPTRDRIGRTASVVFAAIVLYLTVVQTGGGVFTWYLPPATLFACVVLSRAAVTFFGWLKYFGLSPRAGAWPLQAGIVAASAMMLVATTMQIRIQQREIEDGNRTRIGLYLNAQAKPDEVIYLEPLGYIGYFSDRLILDWPGLIAPEVVALRRARPVNQFTLIPHLKPKWLVLRPGEHQAAMRIARVRDNYEIARIFDVRPALEKYAYIPGRVYLEVDSVFYVLRRRDGA